MPPRNPEYQEQDEEFNLKVGQNIREARETLGLSQTDLAIAVGTDHSQISRIESGERGLSMRLGLLIAKRLGVSIRSLHGFRD